MKVKIISTEIDAKNIEALKKQFMDIAGKDKVVYEDDYERICSSIGDTRVVGELQTWLVSSGLQMKKRDPRYERKLKNLMKHPNVDKVRTSMKRVSTKTINTIIEENTDEKFKTEFFAPWKRIKAQNIRRMRVGDMTIIPVGDKWTGQSEQDKARMKQYFGVDTIDESQLEQLYVKVSEAPEQTVIQPQETTFDPASLNASVEKEAAKKVTAQRIDEEKRQLVETLRALESQLPEAKKLIKKVELTDDFHDIHEIWNMLKDQEVIHAHYNKSKVAFGDVEFEVSIANSIEQKTAGLEPFKMLAKNEGMLFPFSGKDSVTFHMGKVIFPIDILFLMESPFGELKVAKIVHNIQPNDDNIWSNPKTKYVLELPGGACQEHAIALGSTCEIL